MADTPDEPQPCPTGQLTLREICADFARRRARLDRECRAAGMTRREFLGAMATGTAAATMAALGPGRSLGEQAPERPSGPVSRSRVVVVTHPEVFIKGDQVNPPLVRQMLNRAVVELAGALSEQTAWQAFGRADDFVAIKYNTLGQPTLRTHPEIDRAVAAELITQARIDPKRILGADRLLPEPYRDLSEPFSLPTNKLKTRLRRLYTDHATAIVNLSVLKSHFNVGISAALKNHLGSVNNPAEYHGWEPNRLPVNLPELNALEPLRRKTRLCIIDAVRPLFAGGPADNEQYRWAYRGLIVGTDPVAVTAVGIRILEAKRREVLGKEWPMTAARQMVAYGQKIGLGNADPKRIDLVEVDMG